MRKFLIVPFIFLLAASCNAPAQRTSQDETANWKEYSNSEFGFSFKYPPNLTMHESRREKDLEIPLSIGLTGSANPLFSGSISIFRGQRPEIPLKNSVTKNIKVGGIATVHKTGERQVGQVLVRQAEYSLHHRGNPFFIDFGYAKPEQKRIVEQILSTFKLF